MAPEFWERILCSPMLQRAEQKSDGTRLQWVEADALRLPFADGSFDLVTSAFGFRNLADYDAGLREIVRVLRPGGECGILECSEPSGWLEKLYGVYFRAGIAGGRHGDFGNSEGSLCVFAGVGCTVPLVARVACAHAGRGI